MLSKEIRSSLFAGRQGCCKSIQYRIRCRIYDVVLHIVYDIVHTYDIVYKYTISYASCFVVLDCFRKSDTIQCVVSRLWTGVDVADRILTFMGNASRRIAKNAMVVFIKCWPSGSARIFRTIFFVHLCPTVQMEGKASHREVSLVFFSTFEPISLTPDSDAMGFPWCTSGQI
jgi:hypothetical protein